MIFKTFDSDNDNIGSKIGVFGKSFNDIKARFKEVSDYLISTNNYTITNMANAWKKTSEKDLNKKFFVTKKDIEPKLVDIKPFDRFDSSKASNILTKLQNQEILVKSNAKTWDNYFSVFKDHEKWQIDFVKNTDLQKASTEDVIKAQNAARNSAIEYNNGLKQMTIGAKVSKVALSALAMAGNMLVSWGIGKALEFAVKKFDEYIRRNEIAIQKADDLKSSLNSSVSAINDKESALNSLSSKFEQLSKGVDKYGNSVSLTTEQSKEYQSLVNELIQINPSLVKGYDAENQAIIDKNTALSETITLLEREKTLALEKATSTNNLKTIGEGAVAKRNELDASERAGQWKNIDLNTVSGQAARFGKEAAKLFDNESIKSFYDYTSHRPGEKMYGKSDWLKSFGINVDEDNLDLDLESYLQKNIETFANNMDDILKNANIDPYSQQAKNLKLYVDEYKTLNKELDGIESSYMDEYIQKIPLLVDSYKDLSDAQKNFISGYIRDNISAYDLKDNPTKVKTNIVDIVEKISNNQQVQDLINNLFAPNPQDLDVGEYYKQYTEIINKIADGLNLPNSIGLGKEIKELKQQYDNALLYTKEKFGTDETKFFEDNSINTPDEIDNWLECAQAANDAIVAKQRYLNLGTMQGDFTNAFHELILDPDEILSKSVDNYINKISSLKDALNQLRSGNMDSSAIATLIKQFPELADKTYDLDKGITDLLSSLTSTDGSSDNLITTLTNQIEELKKAGKDTSSLEYFSEVIKSIGSDVDGLTTAYSKYLKATSTSNAGDIYVGMSEALKKTKELYDDGLVGTDDFKTYASMLSPTGKDDAGNFLENYKNLKKYFDTDTNKGVKSFLTDLSSLNQGYATFDKNSKMWTLNIDDSVKAAKLLNMGLEPFEAMLKRLNDYGFDLDFTPMLAKQQESEKSINQVEDKLKRLKSYSNLVPDGIEKSKLNLNISEYEAAIEKAKQEIETVPKEIVTKLNFDYDITQLNAQIEEYKAQISNGADQSTTITLNSNIITSTDKIIEKTLENAGLKDSEVVIPVEIQAKEKDIENIREQIASVSDEEKIDLQVDLRASQNELLDLIEQYRANPLSLNTTIDANAESFYSELENVELSNPDDKTVEILGDSQDYNTKSEAVKRDNIPYKTLSIITDNLDALNKIKQVRDEQIPDKTFTITTFFRNIISNIVDPQSVGSEGNPAPAKKANVYQENVTGSGNVVSGGGSAVGGTGRFQGGNGTPKSDGKSGKGSKKEKDTYTEFEQEIDWITESLKLLENEINRYQSLLDNSTSEKSKIKYLDLLIEKQTELSNAYSESAKVYSTKYQEAFSKLSKKDQDKIKNGSYTLENIKEKVKQNKDSDKTIGSKEIRYNNIQEALKYRNLLNDTNSNYQDSIFKIKEYATQLADVRWDIAQEKIEKLERSLDLLDSKLNNASGYKEKNKLLDKRLELQKDIVEEEKKAIANSKKDLKASKGTLLKSLQGMQKKLSFKNAAKNEDGTYTATSKATKAEKADIAKHNKIQKNIQQIQSGKLVSSSGWDAQTVSYMEEYNSYVREITENTKEYNLSLEEQKTLQDEIWSDRADNINKDFDKMDSSLEADMDKFQSIISLKESTGLQGSKEDFENLMNVTADRSKVYDNRIKELALLLEKAKKSGTATKETIQELELELKETKNAAFELNETFMDTFDSSVNARVSSLEDSIDNLQKQLESLNEMREKQDLAVDGVNNFYDDQIKAIQGEIDVLQKLNDEKDKQLELEKAQANLAKANQLTDRVYTEEKGYIYVANEENKKDAENTLNDILSQREIDAKQEQIDKLNEYKDKFNEMLEEYEKNRAKQYAFTLLYDGWESDALNGRLENFRGFVNSVNGTKLNIENVNNQIDYLDDQIESLNKWSEDYKQYALAVSSTTSSLNTCLIQGLKNMGVYTDGYQKYVNSSTDSSSQKEYFGIISDLTEDEKGIQEDKTNFLNEQDDILIEHMQAFGLAALKEFQERTENLKKYVSDTEALFARLKAAQSMGGITAGTNVGANVGAMVGMGKASSDGKYDSSQGLSTVSEEKPEILVRDGQSYLMNKPQMVNLKSSDIVLDGEKTRNVLDGKNDIVPISEHLKATNAFMQTKEYQDILSKVDFFGRLESNTNISDCNDFLNKIKEIYKEPSPVQQIIDNRVSIGDIKLEGVQNPDELANAINQRMSGVISQRLHRKFI